MIINRHIRAIVEYLNGGMSPDDRRAFQQRLETDNKLRLIVGQEQEIERALRRDRETIPILGAPAYEKFLNKLNTATTTREAGYAAQKHFDSTFSKGISGPGNKSMLIGLALVGLTAGGLISSGSLPTNEPVPAIQPQLDRAVPHPPSAPAETPATPPAATREAGTAPAVVMEPPAKPYAARKTPTALENHAESVTEQPAHAVKPKEDDEINDYLNRQEQNEGVHTVGGDSVHARLKVNTSKP